MSERQLSGDWIPRCRERPRLGEAQRTAEVSEASLRKAVMDINGDARHDLIHITKSSGLATKRHFDTQPHRFNSPPGAYIPP